MLPVMHRMSNTYTRIHFLKVYSQYSSTHLSKAYYHQHVCDHARLRRALQYRIRTLALLLERCASAPAIRVIVR